MTSLLINAAAALSRRHRQRAWRAALMAAATLLVADAWSAEILIGGDLHWLYTVDQRDASRGTATPLTAARLNDLSSGPDNATLWGVTQSVSIGGAGRVSTLLTIDASTRAATHFTVLNAPASFDLGHFPLTTVAWDPISHGLYGTTYDGHNGALWQINATTGALTLVNTLVGGPDFKDMSGLAFDNRGVLYAISEMQNQVVLSRIDTATAAVTQIGLTGVPYLGENGVEDIAFRPSDHVLFVSSNGLYTLDPATAASTLVGAGAGLSGLAFANLTATVPEPSPWVLTLAGLGMACLRMAGGKRRHHRVAKPAAAMPQQSTRAEFG